MSGSSKIYTATQANRDDSKMWLLKIYNNTLFAFSESLWLTEG